MPSRVRRVQIWRIYRLGLIDDGLGRNEPLTVAVRRAGRHQTRQGNGGCSVESSKSSMLRPRNNSSWPSLAPPLSSTQPHLTACILYRSGEASASSLLGDFTIKPPAATPHIADEPAISQHRPYPPRSAHPSTPPIDVTYPSAHPHRLQQGLGPSSHPPQCTPHHLHPRPLTRGTRINPLHPPSPRRRHPHTRKPTPRQHQPRPFHYRANATRAYHPSLMRRRCSNSCSDRASPAEASWTDR